MTKNEKKMMIKKADKVIASVTKELMEGNNEKARNQLDILHILKKDIDFMEESFNTWYKLMTYHYDGFQEILLGNDNVELRERTTEEKRSLDKAIKRGLL